MALFHSLSWDRHSGERVAFACDIKQCPPCCLVSQTKQQSYGTVAPSPEERDECMALNDSKSQHKAVFGSHNELCLRIILITSPDPVR